MYAHGLLNDILFKIVFGAPNSVPVLRSLLNALLGYSGEQKIVDLTILNPTLDKEYLEDKGIVLDIRAIDSTGRHYNIEVQLSLDRRESYIKRSLYYAASLLCGQLNRGDDYGKLNKTICISLVDFVLFSGTDQLHSTFHLRESGAEHTLLTDVLEVHYIELPKFRSDKPHHLRTPFEKWLHILKFSDIYAAGEETLPSNLLEEEGIQMAIESLKKACADDHIREIIRLREKARKDFATAIVEARAEGLQMAEQERQRAEQERLKVEQLTKRLRELGVDPES